MDSVRVRFAPSPTGFLHVGGVRTALFCWLFARNQGGRFVLRIEDTDRARSTEEAVTLILDGLQWLGLDWDEGPFYQSERTDLYRAAIDRLLTDGNAYRCDCSPEHLASERERALAEKRIPKYNGRCRDRDDVATSGSAVRFRAPRTGATIVEDLIRGPVRFENSQLDDLIIARSDGSPTYNLCVVVDDVDMKISHVIRGDDHLNNTPRQAVLYQALGYALPKFAHLPMILAPDRRKLSKRDGAASVTEYRDEGLLPEAVVNYLARLGWSHGDQEVFTVPELIEKFSLEQVGKAGAVFDREKLLWVNSQHLRAADPLRIMGLVEAQLATDGVAISAWVDDPWRKQLFDACATRSRTVAEMADMAACFYRETIHIDPDAAKKGFRGEPIKILDQVAQSLANATTFDAAHLESVFQALVESSGLGLGKFAQPVRTAITGRRVSPGIYDCLELLGRERTLARIAAARAQLVTDAD